MRRLAFECFAVVACMMAVLARGEDVEFTAVVEGPPVFGENVSLVMTFTNGTTGNIVVPSDAGIVVACVDLLDSMGKKAKLTALGKEARAAVSMSPGRGTIIPAREEYKTIITLNHYYEMRHPDDYQIKVSVSYYVPAVGKRRRVQITPKCIPLSYQRTSIPQGEVLENRSSSQ